MTRAMLRTWWRAIGRLADLVAFIVVFGVAVGAYLLAGAMLVCIWAMLFGWAP